MSIERDKLAINNVIYFARQNGLNEACFGGKRLAEQPA